MTEATAWERCLSALKRADISGEAYWRSVPRVFQDTALEWIPSFLDGNRYNPKEEFAALYFAGCNKLAEKESEGKAKPQYLEPRQMLEFRITIGGVLDLTDEENLVRIETELKVSREELIQPAGPTGVGYKTPQEIGRAAYRLKIPGLRVPTSRPNEEGLDCWHNLALFPAKLISSIISPAL